jgi:ribosomal protein S18 acetylase RimI-like enzyme
MSVRVRRLAPGDRESLEAVIRSDDSFRDDEIAVALELIDEALSDPSSDYWVRVAELDGAVAGYLCFGPTPMTRETFDLYWLVTAARWRGRGVARALVSAMEAELRERGGGSVRVETSDTEGYGAARRLYEGLGYPEAGRLANFYAPGDDLVIYFKRILKDRPEASEPRRPS